MRLSKYIAGCGVCSRRKAEEAILAGRVSVNGIIVAELGTKVAPGDAVSFDGAKISPEAKLVYIMLNKPEGYITTAREQFGRPSVLDLVPADGVRLVPVGRLDCATSGMLILTNDGELVYRLTHPSHDIRKTYISRIEGMLCEESIAQIRGGLIVDGYKTSRAHVKVLSVKEGSSLVEIAIKEGRNRQVRKIFDQLGHKIDSLRRVATGSLRLGDLRKGQWRHLANDEVAYLKNC
ncbi:MAG: rRNA pseudouridine synthase [Defluviitaleaceae bacterium]|nr:rRNA pseudouridine synthase [Defluviitaleaceae bacterium]